MLVGLSGALLAVLAQVGGVEVRVTWSPDSAVVDATFDFETASAVRFVMPRLRGQVVRFLEPDRSAVQAVSGAAELRTTAQTERPERVRYVVEGRVARIPLPVPDVPMAERADAVTIRLRGPFEDRDIARGFPRFQTGSGEIVATLANVPSLMTVPPPSGTWSVSRLADLFVLVLLAAGSLVWGLRQRRISRPA